MRLTTTSIIVCFGVAFGGCTKSHDKPNDRSISLPVRSLRGNKEGWVGHLRESRRRSEVSFIQAIPESKLQKFCAIQFDTQPDGRPGPDWRPRFVIVWKAEHFGSICFDPILRSTIGINGHLIRPPSGKNAVYALQPDYSITQLPLTAEESTRLFSYITAREKRTDERVASLIELIERDDPHWNEGVSAEVAEEQLFPSEPYWERKVDPHLKVVEPSQGSSGDTQSRHN